MEPSRAWGGRGKGEDGQLGSGVGGQAWLLWAFRAGRAQRCSLKCKPRKAWSVWQLSGPPRTGLLAHQLHVCISLRGLGDRDSSQGERSGKECWRGLQTLEDQRGGIKLPGDIKSQHTSRGPLPRPLGRVVCFSELRHWYRKRGPSGNQIPFTFLQNSPQFFSHILMYFTFTKGYICVLCLLTVARLCHSSWVPGPMTPPPPPRFGMGHIICRSLFF